MPYATRRRIRPYVVMLTALGGAGVLAIAGCGSEQESTSGSTTATQVTEPSTSVPVVAGPSPQSQVSSTDAVTSGLPTERTCGTAPGPDGSLRVVILAGDVDCGTATQIAAEYAPKIATGQQQHVSGWTCGPSEVRGILAACQSESTVIGFTP